MGDDPFPVLTAQFDNSVAYGKELAGALEVSMQRFGDIFGQLPDVLKTAFTDFSSGDVGEGMLTLNSWFGSIFSLNGPLIPVGDALLRILDSSSENNAIWTDPVPAFLLTAVMGQLIFAPNAAMFEFALKANDIGTAFADGDNTTAFNEILNLPSAITGAYLNGVDFADFQRMLGMGWGQYLQTSPLAGLLSNPEAGFMPPHSNGTIWSLIKLQDAIVDKIQPYTPYWPTQLSSAESTDPLAGLFGSHDGDFTAQLGTMLNDLGAQLDSLIPGLGDLPESLADLITGV